MPRARLAALHTLLAGLVARPEPGILVLACADTEVFYPVQALTQLDEASPADRFLLHTADLTTVPDYIITLHHAAGLPAPDNPTNPTAHLDALITALLADLPPGDHHLVLALLPTTIHDLRGLASLVAHLLAHPLDPRLRLIVRDDRDHPQHLHLAAASPSAQHLAHVFSLPPELLLDAVRSLAHDPRARPDDRAQALLQLACQDLGHRRHADALARCDAVRALATSEPLQLLARAFKADVLRHSGDPQAALALATATLHRAVALQLHPIVLHLALALAGLTRELGRPADARACLELAEKAAHHNPAVQARVRALRAELPC